MDFTYLLPLEVSQHIFSCLSVTDLGRCLRVSKQWRHITNDNIFWKRHCENYGLSDEDEFKKVNSDLCHWGSIWNSFSKSLAYKWHSNSYRKIELGDNDYESFTSSDAYIAVYSKKFNNVDVYTVKDNTNRARLLVSLALCLPEQGTALLAMDSDYIIVAKFNMLHLFKRNENTYELCCTYAIIFNTVLFAEKDFSRFVNEYLNLGSHVEIDAFFKHIIWISNFEGSIVIDLSRNTCYNVFSYETSRFQGEMLITWSDDSLLVYSIDGTTEGLLQNIDGLEDVTANSTVFALLRVPSNDSSLIEVYDIETHEKILTKEVSIYTWIKLHPKEEILYTLESCCRKVFRITSSCARTGSLKWCFETNNDAFVSYWELHLVCNNYLVSWPTASKGSKFYLLDSRTGKCIYEDGRPIGLINFVSDTLWISWAEKNLLDIRSYA